MQEKILKKARSSELRGEQEELNQKRLTSSKRKKKMKIKLKWMLYVRQRLKKERKNRKSKTTKWRITVSRQTEETVDRQNQGRH